MEMRVSKAPVKSLFPLLQRRREYNGVRLIMTLIEHLIAVSRGHA
jgi:hypothetical protein